MDSVQFDGLTTVLKIDYDVLPYYKYKIKLAIGDGSDGLFDSAIFLEEGSFTSVEDADGIYYDSVKVNNTRILNTDSILGLKEFKSKKPVVKKLPPIPEVFQFSNVYFSQNSHIIEDSFTSLLDSVANYLTTSSDSLLCTIVGHTDQQGSVEYNQVLSLRRATAVSDYLVSKGVVRKTIQILGSHFSSPVSTNSKQQEQSKNRRVELIIERQ